MRVLIATKNAGKKAELERILDGLGYTLLMPPDLGIDLDVEETGSSYRENALLKAVAFCQASGLLTLADDSGLEVDALDGAPGIYSARYGGPGLDDEGRYRLLLQEMKGIPEAERTARFRCVIALVWPSGRQETVSGVCKGRILSAPRGEHGFGYDPVFFVLDQGRAMAELPAEVKNVISHRARAMAFARDILAQASRDAGATT